MAHGNTAPAYLDAPAVTQQLARFVSNHPSRGWTSAVNKEAARTFLNWLGCAIGAADHITSNSAMAAIQVLQPAAQSTVLGRKERVDIANAAFLNGISSHTFDFDDTHLKTIIYPAGPVASAILAMSEVKGKSGQELLDALVIGIDVACRVGNAMYPDHYSRGWHITGTTGTLGAAAGCARLLGLDEQRTTMALGIAASQPVGLREQFGTMTKPLHPGAAAKAGLKAALLAQNGFTASTRSLEAPRGFMQVISDKFDWNEISENLGERFEISYNSYKPFACGIVIHPSIEACTRLHAQGITAADIRDIRLKVHPLVLELTGKKEPRNGLEAKFSVFHASAVGLIFGRASEAEFADEVVARRDVETLRGKIVATAHETIAEDACELIATLADGREIGIAIEHAVGSLGRPMSDADLETKFHGLADPILGSTQTKALLNVAWETAEAKDVHQLVRLATPQSQA